MIDSVLSVVQCSLFGVDHSITIVSNKKLWEGSTSVLILQLTNAFL